MIRVVLFYLMYVLGTVDLLDFKATGRSSCIKTGQNAGGCTVSGSRCRPEIPDAVE
eukprot:m.93629 g.93629  ORF g.93629 m.93629 type:complete len:56 (+) comp36790_c0_seq1:1041-1208(+)